MEYYGQPVSVSNRSRGPIYKISYDNLTIMPKLRSTYDQRAMNGKLFIGKIYVQNHNIVGDGVRKLAYDIPERNFSTF